LRLLLRVAAAVDAKPAQTIRAAEQDRAASSEPQVVRQCRRGAVLALAVWVLLTTSAIAQYQGWLIPEGGKDEKSPLTSSADVVTTGKALYLAHCARCHGRDGKGNGPDADYAADLTDNLRFDLNTGGVLFYKVWNGHAIQLRTQVDDMPAFKDKLSKEQVWTIVEYVKSLR
jgi:mono/diheme cytochrome c family protein